MLRCFDLALRGRPLNGTNPIVGAVLVYQDRIIGEGYFSGYGQAHAEVEALRSVSEEDRQYVNKSTLYVSLEPCNFYGKTPPCVDLILREHIPKVVISAIDHTSEVDGKGIARLRAKGVQVEVGVLEKRGLEIAESRNHLVRTGQPEVILKWAETADGYLGHRAERLMISNPFQQRLVHHWRSQVQGILVGSQTVLQDNPQLTTRFVQGSSPARFVLDPKGVVSSKSRVLNCKSPAYWITHKEKQTPDGIKNIVVEEGERFLERLLSKIALEGISTLMVEGGAYTLSSFIRNGLWSKAYRTIALESNAASSEADKENLVLAPKIHVPVYKQIMMENNMMQEYRNKPLKKF